jgi:hypothetical protein
MSVNQIQNKKRLKIFEKISNNEIKDLIFDNIDETPFFENNFESSLPQISKLVLNEIDTSKFNCDPEVSYSTDIIKLSYIDYEKEFSENFNCLHLSLPFKIMNQIDIFTFLSFYGGIEQMKVQTKENISQ